jgi:hypothetical protein
MLPLPPDAPDGDAAEPLATWTPERQIAHMLDLCEAQMESALAESDVAVDALIRSFSGLIEAARAVSAPAGKVPAQSQQAAMAAQLAAVEKQTSAAIVAFQFYDKLTQRLGHVRYSLSAMAMFICDGAKASERDQWRRLFSTLKRLYRTEEERQIFKMMVEGATAEEAREHIHQSTLSLKVEPAGDVEIF